jgi:hypothetical protein
MTKGIRGIRVGGEQTRGHAGHGFGTTAGGLRQGGRPRLCERFVPTGIGGQGRSIRTSDSKQEAQQRTGGDGAQPETREHEAEDSL